MKNLRNKIKNTRGITLIALIVTIIVLLILAGVVINMTVGNNGIIGKAQSAVDKYQNAQDSEINMIDGYLSILDYNNDQIIVGSRTEAWNGATMLTINVSNITGGTFTINVNNIEASNYGKLYYYVNDKLVYSGTNTSFKVTNIDGQLINENETYKVKVLAEPFEMSVTTGEGDRVDSWLACIGNPNSEGYTIENLDKLFANEILLTNLLKSETAVNYLFKSTEEIYPQFLNYLKTKTEFTQPKLTSNSTTVLEGKIIVTSSSKRNEETEPYMAFTNSMTNYVDADYWQMANGNSEWIKIVFPYYIWVTGIDFYTRPTYDQFSEGNIIAYSSELKNKVIGQKISTNKAATKYTMQVNKTLTNTVYFYVEKGHSDWYGIQNIQIHGYKF